jgi:HEAT repeat protein
MQRTEAADARTVRLSIMKTHICRFRRFLVLTAAAGWLILSLSAAAPQDTNQPRRPVLVGRDGASNGRSLAPEVQEQIARLSSEDALERKRAVLALRRMGALGEPALPALARLSQSRSPSSTSDDFDAILTARRTVVSFAKRNPDSVIALLEHEDERVRKSAMTALGECGDARAVPALMKCFRAYRYWGGARELEWALVRLGKLAVPPLIGALHAPHEAVRSNAARVLGEIADPQAIKPLQDAFRANQKWGRSTAQAALEKFGESVVPFFIESLGSASPVTRAGAASALGSIGDTRAVEPVIATLKDENWRVSWNAARTLGHLKNRQAVGPLLQALEHPNVNVRSAAASSLGSIGDVRAIEPLIVLLKTDEHTRDDVARALGNLADSRAVGPLIDTLTDEEPMVRAAAAGALGRLGDPAAVLSLIERLDDPQLGVRSTAAGALAAIGDERALQPLIAALKEEHPLPVDPHRSLVYPCAAARALGKFGDPRAVQPLIEALRHPHFWVRYESARVLGTLKDMRAVEPLIDAIPSLEGGGKSDIGGPVSNAAVDALCRLTGENNLGDQDKWRRWWRSQEP